MHCPKVAARTATPLWTYRLCGTTTTSVTPGMRATAPRLSTARTRPLIVGARQTIVGRAPGTSRSIAKRFSPVTIDRPSIRAWSLPRSFSALVGFSVGRTTAFCETAPSSARSPSWAISPATPEITPSTSE